MKTNDCRCHVEYNIETGLSMVIYCPLHAAAPEMYEALKAAQEGTGDWRAMIDLTLAEVEAR